MSRLVIEAEDDPSSDEGPPSQHDKQAQLTQRLIRLEADFAAEEEAFRELRAAAACTMQRLHARRCRLQRLLDHLRTMPAARAARPPDDYSDGEERAALQWSPARGSPLLPNRHSRRLHHSIGDDDSDDSHSRHDTDSSRSVTPEPHCPAKPAKKPAKKFEQRSSIALEADEDDDDDGEQLTLSVPTKKKKSGSMIKQKSRSSGDNKATSSFVPAGDVQRFVVPPLRRLDTAPDELAASKGSPRRSVRWKTLLGTKKTPRGSSELSSTSAAGSLDDMSLVFRSSTSYTQLSSASTSVAAVTPRRRRDPMRSATTTFESAQRRDASLFEATDMSQGNALQYVEWSCEFLLAHGGSCAHVFTSMPDAAALRAFRADLTCSLSSLLNCGAEALPCIVVSLQRFFHDLLQPLLAPTAALSVSFWTCLLHVDVAACQLFCLRTAVRALPPANRAAAALLFRALHDICRRQPDQLDSAAYLFGPSLLRSQLLVAADGAAAASLVARTNVADVCRVTALLINRADAVFFADDTDTDTDTDTDGGDYLLDDDNDSNGLLLTAATLDRAIDFLLLAPYCDADAQYVDCFFLTHSYHVTADELLRRLVAVYAASAQHDSDWHARLRARVLWLVRHWLEEFSEELQTEQSGFIPLLAQFIDIPSSLSAVPSPIVASSSLSLSPSASPVPPSTDLDQQFLDSPPIHSIQSSTSSQSTSNQSTSSQSTSSQSTSNQSTSNQSTSNQSTSNQSNVFSSGVDKPSSSLCWLSRHSGATLTEPLHDETLDPSLPFIRLYALRLQEGSKNRGRLLRNVSYFYKDRKAAAAHTSLLSLLAKHDVYDIAKTLTLIDHSHFKSIPSRDFLSSRFQTAELAPSYCFMVNRFNSLGLWIAGEVLEHGEPAQRAAALALAIHVGAACLELRNFNTCFAILAGLNLASISRLRQTWSCLSKKDRQVYARLLELFEMTNNFAAYRTAYTQAALPKVPYLMVIPKDLIAIEDNNATCTADQLINFYKMRLIFRSVSEIRRTQQAVYSFPSSPQLHVALNKITCLSEDELWERSMIVEPREST